MAEPSAAPEPAPPVPETVDTEADRVLYHAGTDAPPRAPPPVRTPRADTYTIQHGDTLTAIAAHFYGAASQWSVIAQADLQRTRCDCGSVENQATSYSS